MSGYGQIQHLSVTATKDSILIGEQTEIHIRLIKDKNVTVNFPHFRDTIVNGIEILSISGIDTVQSGKDLILSQILHVTSFDSGQYVIPPFHFPIEFSGIKDTVYSIPLVLNISMPEIDPASDFRDIKPVINTPVNLREALPFIAGGLLILLLAFASYFFYRKYMNKRRGVISNIPDVPAYIIALEELQKLHIEKAWEKWSIKDYYTKLSGIVRTYIENQFGINALESTTVEILKNFQKVYGKDRDIKAKLEELLQLSDLVKFAKETPFADLNLKNLDKAVLFVELTKPAAVSEEKENETDKKKNE